jgi:hypothetical protein
VRPAGPVPRGAVGRAPLGIPGRRGPPGGGGIGLPDALSGRPGGGGIGLPDELSGGRGGRVAPGPGPGPAGGPVRVGCAARVGATVPVVAAAALAAASRSIDGVAVRGGTGAATSGATVLVDAAAVRCEEMTLVTAGGRAAGCTICGSGAGAVARGADGSSWWSGETGRRSPSASALRRTRSAWASSIDEEWLFTPMPREMERSRASLLVRPSSLASS